MRNVLCNGQSLMMIIWFMRVKKEEKINFERAVNVWLFMNQIEK